MVTICGNSHLPDRAGHEDFYLPDVKITCPGQSGMRYVPPLYAYNLNNEMSKVNFVIQLCLDCCCNNLSRRDSINAKKFFTVLN